MSLPGDPGPDRGWESAARGDLAGGPVPGQRRLAPRIVGLAGCVDEASLCPGEGDRLVDLRDHPLQRDFWWGSAAFEEEFGPLDINEILGRICADFGIAADLSGPIPLEAHPRPELGALGAARERDRRSRQGLARRPVGVGGGSSSPLPASTSARSAARPAPATGIGHGNPRAPRTDARVGRRRPHRVSGGDRRRHRAHPHRRPARNAHRHHLPPELGLFPALESLPGAPR